MSGTCAAIAAASACVISRASSLVLGSPTQSGLSSPGALAEHWRSDSICLVYSSTPKSSILQLPVLFKR